MSMYIQTLNGRIVGVCGVQGPGFDMAMELPPDFDYDHIDRYEITDGGLVYHAPDEPDEEQPTQDERLAALEQENIYLKETLEIILSGDTGEVAADG